MAAGTPESGTAMTRSASAGLLARQLHAQLLAHLVHRAAEQLGVRLGEVDVLEDAAARPRRARRGGCERSPFSSMTTISPGSISRMNSASIRSSAVVSEAST